MQKRLAIGRGVKILDQKNQGMFNDPPPPPPASLGVKNNKPWQSLLVLIKRKLVVSDSYVIVRGGSGKSGTKGLLEGGSIYAQKNVFLILSTRRNAEGVGALSTTPVNLPLPVVVR